MKPHKHQETIIAWAAGEKVEWSDDGVTWVALGKGCPLWDAAEFWRVKPAEPEKVYPFTKMTHVELHTAYFIGRPGADVIWSELGLRQVCDAALRHACDNGQIVTREDFDRAVGDRKKRDIAVALAVRQAIENRISLIPAIVNGHRLSISFQNFDVLDIINEVKS